MKLFVVLNILLMSSLYASDGGASSLIAPFLNLGVLIVLLVWKLRKPISNVFTKKAQEVSNIVESANQRAKEVQLLLERQQEKINNFDQEVVKLKNETADSLKRFESQYEIETKQKIDSLKKEANSKIEVENRTLFNQLSGEIIDVVIAKSKETISASEDLRNKSTEQLIREVN